MLGFQLLSLGEEAGGCQQPQVIGQADHPSRLLGDLSAGSGTEDPASLHHHSRRVWGVSTTSGGDPGVSPRSVQWTLSPGRPLSPDGDPGQLCFLFIILGLAWLCLIIMEI